VFIAARWGLDQPARTILGGTLEYPLLTHSTPAFRPRVVVIEADERRAAAHEALLTKHGLQTELWGPSDDPVKRVRARPPDVVVIGGLKAGVTGIELCRALRAVFGGTLVLLVENSRENELGAMAGADDCVLKPVTSFGLLARVRALLGRSKGEKRIVVGRLVLDESYRRATVDGKPLALSDTEFGLLQHLAKHCGQIVPREDLQNVLSGISHELARRGLEQRLSRLGAKLRRADVRLEAIQGSAGFCLAPELGERAAE
jgi:DNA-binding response OmpR family regulator